MVIDERNAPLFSATWYYLPEVTAQPASVTTAAGKPATFVVETTDADSIQWQYRKPGEKIWTNVSTNGTDSAYSLTTAARHDGYKYRCKLTSDMGSVYSNIVTLTVKVKPVIKTQPKKLIVNAGQTATFSVAATKAYGYMWQYQKPGSSAWTDVSKDGDAATYTLTTAARHNGYKYRCKVTNAAGTVYTSAVKLTVK